DLEARLEQVRPSTPTSVPKGTPKREPLPAELPRREIRHEPESSTCRCGCELKRIGEDVAERLDYTPGVFSVERHVRGKWVCAQCETLVQAPVPAHVIDKGLPTCGLLADRVDRPAGRSPWCNRGAARRRRRRRTAMLVRTPR